MKNYLLILIYILPGLIVVHNQVISQEIDWNRFSLGIHTGLGLPTGDLKEYWSNPFIIGLSGEYQATEKFSLSSGTSLSFYKKDDKYNTQDIPKLVILSIPLEIKYYKSISNKYRLSFALGIDNNIFLFSGKAATDFDPTNTTESEFGFCISTGIEKSIKKRLRSELFVKYQSIFSMPENIKITRLGVKLFFL